MFKKLWAKIKTFFKDSETIAWARFQMLLGSIVSFLLYAFQDPTINQAIQTILNPKYVPFYIIGAGVLTEIFRRLRASDME